MEILNPNPSESNSHSWQDQLDDFGFTHQKSLAALSWRLYQQQLNSDQFLGIDLKPDPHFITCSRAAIEQLNQKVDRKLQEILGLMASFNPEIEVLIIGIAENRVKLIYFAPDPPPPECDRQLGQDTDSLLEYLETQLSNSCSNHSGS
ncbi:MAG: hypothetical protein HC835_11085 [Oscillatoriales cyanobacterium RM2_1_1]|nr:hypothetical protein [Oscillatoriales cyanobacterium SM2_3_0]NJO46120.1 hypothetical protein [Oscillatoriales cyanobacterium RM2_1_1]